MQATAAGKITPANGVFHGVRVAEPPRMLLNPAGYGGRANAHRISAEA